VKLLKIVAPPLLVGACVLACVFGYILVMGPRMRTQPSIKSFQARMPTLPAGVVPVEPAPTLPPTTATNPLSPSEEHYEWGKTYYEYYCLFCHGAKGDGNGPVGQSYIPLPTNLRLARVQALSDGELYHAMLNGVGHAPVLERVVPCDHRWYLVLYIRSFNQTSSVTASR
jgi:hypothetical protein